MISEGVIVEPGAEVEADGRRYLILRVLDLTSVIAQDTITGISERLAIPDLLPARPITEPSTGAADLASLETRDWNAARSRLEIIKPFLDDRRHSRREFEERAAQFGYEATALYRWRRIFRSTGKVTSLIPRVRQRGGRGKSRLENDAEIILKSAINEYFLTPQQPTREATILEVRRRCRSAGINPPHGNTIRKRISQLSEYETLRRRAHSKTAKDRYLLRPGTFDDAGSPLAIVQIDHTVLDISLVDDVFRLPIGRPHITLVFDVYSRMVLGFCISLDPSGALSTGLALCHAIFPKEEWLAHRNITNRWPCWGFPAKIHVDNAKEFRGDMLKKACQQYNMDIDFRPVLTPHYGGHIERMLGTLGKGIRILPGATFSNPQERGDYDSEKRAVMTLGEIESWIAEYITGVYHERLHAGIKTTPIKRWEDATIGKGRLPVGMRRRVESDRIRFDFLPFEERTIQDYGVQIDNIQYFDEVLRPFANQKVDGKPKQFVFRRDPRDISTLHFWNEDLNQYCPIPYRNVSRPAMSIWEYRRALDDAKADNEHVDEEAIFASYERLRKRQEDAAGTTKAVRRAAARKSTAQRAPRLRLVVNHGLTPTTKQRPDPPDRSDVQPFEIEDV